MYLPWLTGEVTGDPYSSRHAQRILAIYDYLKFEISEAYISIITRPSRNRKGKKEGRENGETG